MTTRRAGLCLGAVLLAVAALLGIAPGARSEGPATTYTLTLVPQLTTSSLPANPTGAEAALPSDARTLTGVCFRVTRVAQSSPGVPVDLSSASSPSWRAISSLRAPVSPDLLSGDTQVICSSASTDHRARLSTTIPGLFEVTPLTQASASEPVVAWSNGSPAEVTAQLNPPPAFLVTLPVRGPDGSFNDGVWAYPKFTAGGLTKRVTDQGRFLASDGLEYRLTAQVRPTSSSAPLTGLRLSDTLPAGLAVDPGDVTVTARRNGAALALPVGSSTVAVADGVLTVALTDAGTAVISPAAEGGGRVEIEVKVLGRVAAGTGLRSDVLTNTATVEQTVGGTTTTDTSNPVTTNVATLHVRKVGPDGSLLPGARFELYTCRSATELLTRYPDVLSADTGEVTVPHLVWSSFANNTAIPAAQQVSYCLKETQAPAGYLGAGDPVMVVVSEQTVTTTQTPAGPRYNVTVTVVNQPVVPVDPDCLPLPMTGGTGIGVILVLGTLLVVGTVARRRGRGSAPRIAALVATALVLPLLAAPRAAAAEPSLIPDGVCPFQAAVPSAPATAAPTPSAGATASPTASPSATPTASPEATVAPTPPVETSTPSLSPSTDPAPVTPSATTTPSPSATPDPTPSVTPTPTATPDPTPTTDPPTSAAVRYTALGDSYGAGVGSFSPTGDPCYRSREGYPGLIEAAVAPAAFAYLSCSGATIDTLTATQLPAISPDTTHLSLTIGGNDANFVPVLMGCVPTGFWRLMSPVVLPDCQTELARGNSQVDAIGPRLDALLTQIKAAAPQATIAVTGYPLIFDGASCLDTLNAPLDNIAAMDALNNRINAELAAAAQRAGVRFVDVRPAFSGHSVCGAQGQWLNGFIGEALTNATLQQEMFHPNDLGQQAYADLVRKALGLS